MQGFAELLDKLIEDLFGYQTGFTQAKESFAQQIMDLKTFVVDFSHNTGDLIKISNVFVGDNTIVTNLLGTGFALWAIIIVARAAKNCIGG